MDAVIDGRPPREDGGRDQSFAATDRETPRSAYEHQKLEDRGKDISLQPIVLSH